MAANDTRRAIFTASLSHGSTIAQAATAAGVSKRTGIRWHAAPDLQADLAQRRADATGRTRDRLGDLTDAAVTRLGHVLADPDTPPATAVRAATEVLARYLAYDTAATLERRLATVERVAGVHSRHATQADLYHELENLLFDDGAA